MGKGLKSSGEVVRYYLRKKYRWSYNTLKSSGEVVSCEVLRNTDGHTIHIYVVDAVANVLSSYYLSEIKKIHFYDKIFQRLVTNLIFNNGQKGL